VLIAGIAHPPQELHERSDIPSGELIYLAKRALRVYKATRLITSLSPGWEQALAKAALELSLPYCVAVPYPGRDADWNDKLQVQYLSLLARAESVDRLAENYSTTALFEGHIWCVEQSQIVLALWDYEFNGFTFDIIDHAVENGRTVVNLWKEWSQLSSMRRRKNFANQIPRPKGAQIYDA
jgi:hypothetical protein